MLLQSEKDKIHEEACTAASNGLDRTACPYPLGSQAREEWLVNYYNETLIKGPLSVDDEDFEWYGS